MSGKKSAYGSPGVGPYDDVRSNSEELNFNIN
jgi:hypothetical protein